MSEQLEGNWRKNYDFRFLSGEDLEEDVTVTIIKVAIEEVQGKAGKESVMALHFKGTPKMMAVNKTNAKTISKVIGSSKTEYWVGKQIILHAKTEKAFGSEHRVIRVKMQKV